LGLRPDVGRALIQRICAESGVDPRGLALHSDKGKPMGGKTMIALRKHRRCTSVGRSVVSWYDTEHRHGE